MTDTPNVRHRFRWNGDWREITPAEDKIIELASNHFLVHSENGSFEVFVLPDGAFSDGTALDGTKITHENGQERIIRERFLVSKQAGTNQTSEHVIKAPMPGLVRAVKVATGDEVERNSTVLVLEAMKMENNILAGAKGRIRRILVEEGSSVEKNAKLIELETT